MFNLISKREHNRIVTEKNMHIRLMERRLNSQRTELRKLLAEKNAKR